MKASLIGARATYQEQDSEESITGTIVSVAYYGADNLKSYLRGFDLLLLLPDGTLKKVCSTSVKIENLEN